MGVQAVRSDVFLIVIDQICDRFGLELARTSQIAEGLGISDGITSTMLKQLDQDGLVIHRPYKGAKLTKSGRGRMIKVLWRVRLIELWLSTSLDLEQEFLTDEALRMEVVASEKLIRVLDSVLGQPEFDLKGKSLPRAERTLPKEST